MCIIKALQKAKTPEEREKIIATFKQIEEAAKTKAGFCKLAGKHEWIRTKNGAGNVGWLCQQCERWTRLEERKAQYDREVQK